MKSLAETRTTQRKFNSVFSDPAGANVRLDRELLSCTSVAWTLGGNATRCADEAQASSEKVRNSIHLEKGSSVLLVTGAIRNLDDMLAPATVPTPPRAKCSTSSLPSRHPREHPYRLCQEERQSPRRRHQSPALVCHRDCFEAMPEHTRTGYGLSRSQRHSSQFRRSDRQLPHYR